MISEERSFLEVVRERLDEYGEVVIYVEEFGEMELHKGNTHVSLTMGIIEVDGTDADYYVRGDAITAIEEHSDV